MASADEAMVSTEGETRDLMVAEPSALARLEPAQPAVPSERTTVPVPSIQAQVPSAAPGNVNVNTPVNVSVNVNAPAMPMIISAPRGHSFLVRALWYLFIGWWLSAIVIVLGYALMITIIGIPVAFALFNRIPQALTLRPRTTEYRAEVRNGITYITTGTIEQRPWFLRAAYFLLIGWWFGAVWLTLAWAIGLLIVTLPISFLMYNRTSGVMTLQRH